MIFMMWVVHSCLYFDIVEVHFQHKWHVMKKSKELINLKNVYGTGLERGSKGFLIKFSFIKSPTKTNIISYENLNPFSNKPPELVAEHQKASTAAAKRELLWVIKWLWWLSTFPYSLLVSLLTLQVSLESI